MTFAHYDFTSGSSIHEHLHPQEEVYEVIDGELEIAIDGVAQVVRPGLVAIVELSASVLVQCSASSSRKLEVQR